MTDAESVSICAVTFLSNNLKFSLRKNVGNTTYTLHKLIQKSKPSKQSMTAVDVIVTHVATRPSHTIISLDAMLLAWVASCLEH